MTPVTAFVLGILLVAVIQFAWHGMCLQDKELEEAKKNGTNINS